MVGEVNALEVRRQLLPRVLSKLVKVTRKVLFLDPPHILDYRYEDFWAERELLKKAIEIRPDVVHVLYGDEQLDLLLRTSEPLSCPLVVSFHLPTSRAKPRFDSIDRKFLSRIDAVIVLATFQLKDYLKWFDKDQLFYVPHGIDTNRFRPDPHRPFTPGIRLATVGTHMRDWNAIERIIRHFEERNLPVRFYVVDSYNHCRFLNKYKNVHLLSSLNEDDLIRLYQNSDALLLPVTSATANNSALESMACGTPVISTAVEGMPDYVDASSGWLFPKGEVEAIVRLIEDALNNPAFFSELRRGTRKKALEFSWEKVSAQVKEVYKIAVSRGKVDRQL